MIVFDVTGNDFAFGEKGERGRLFLTEEGYQKAMEHVKQGNMKILNHAKVSAGHLNYDRKDQVL